MYVRNNGDVPKVGYFRDIPVEFKIKSLYSNDLILNVASKSKETVQKLKFLDSPSKKRKFLEVPDNYSLQNKPIGLQFFYISAFVHKDTRNTFVDAAGDFVGNSACNVCQRLCAIVLRVGAEDTHLVPALYPRVRAEVNHTLIHTYSADNREELVTDAYF